MPWSNASKPRPAQFTSNVLDQGLQLIGGDSAATAFLQAVVPLQISPQASCPARQIPPQGKQPVTIEAAIQVRLPARHWR